MTYVIWGVIFVVTIAVIIIILDRVAGRIKQDADNEENRP